mgnify:CR=1 FL=1
MEKEFLGLVEESFKPCYKWMTFNTLNGVEIRSESYPVLNLVINGWPSILRERLNGRISEICVLNLVINGWPSIHKINLKDLEKLSTLGFKPCYKWMTFNTYDPKDIRKTSRCVLNLVINGWPSILQLQWVKI